ncbi:MAG: ABC transporter permease [Nitrospira sp.]|nr:ABC transporter permease [Nitrospira sp.]
MRSSGNITWTVWKALFLREAVSRLSTGRAAWLWILLEPVVHLVFLSVLFETVRQILLPGIDGALFITTGVLGFLIAQNTAMRCKDAISANAALFTYRQVLPIDTVLVRAALEAALVIISVLVLLTGLGLLGYNVMPYDVLQVFLAVGTLWLVGVGMGLILSVISELIPELGKLSAMVFRPLYFLSAVMYPAAVVPAAYQDVFLLNPLVHGIELIRGGYFSPYQYHTISGVSAAYITGFAMVTICLGLALHVRFVHRIVEQ